MLVYGELACFEELIRAGGMMPAGRAGYVCAAQRMWRRGPE